MCKISYCIFEHRRATAKRGTVCRRTTTVLTEPIVHDAIVVFSRECLVSRECELVAHVLSVSRAQATVSRAHGRSSGPSAKGLEGGRVQGAPGNARKAGCRSAFPDE